MKGFKKNVVLPLSTVRPVWLHHTPQELTNLHPPLTDIFMDENYALYATPSDPEQNNNIIREPTIANNTISPHSTTDPRSTLSSINSTPTTKYETVPHSSSSTLSPTTTITTSYPYLTTSYPYLKTNHTR